MGRLKDNTSVTISFIFSSVPFILVLLGEETAKLFLKQIKEKITFFSPPQSSSSAPVGIITPSRPCANKKNKTNRKIEKRDTTVYFFIPHLRTISTKNFFRVQIFIVCKSYLSWHFKATTIMNENFMPNSYLCCLFIFDKCIQLQYCHTYTLFLLMHEVHYKLHISGDILNKTHGQFVYK